MARRPEVGGLSQPRLAPAASPTELYIGRSAAGDNLREIAQGLQNLAPSLFELTRQQVEKERKRGASDATAIYEEVKATGQKIKTGELAAHESKWYKAAAKEQVGRLLANAYGQDLLLASEADEALKASTEPQDFDSFEAGFRKQWMEEHFEGGDPALMAGFNTVSGQSILNARQRFVAQAADRLDGQVLENTYTEHQLAIREGLAKGVSMQDIAKNLADRNAAFYLANPKLGPGKAGRSLNKTTIEAVFDAARAFENPDLLKILDHLPGGVKGSTLGQTRAALSKVDEVAREIRTNRQSRLLAEEKDEKRERKEAVETVYTSVIAALEENPETDVSVFAEKLMSIDRTEVSKVFALARAFKTAANTDDEGVARGLYSQALEDDLTEDDINDAFKEGRITVPTMKSLRTMVRQNRAKTGREPKFLIQDQVFKAYEKDLDDLFISHAGGALDASGVYARQQFRQEWVKWRSSDAGAAATEQERLDWLQLAVERTFTRQASGLPAAARAKRLSDAAKKPDAPYLPRPTLPDWKTEEVTPWKDWNFDGFVQQWNDVKAHKRTRMDPWAENIITTHQLKPTEIDAFIAAQRKARQKPSGR